MNSHSSPEPAADCSAASSSDGEQLPLLSTSPIARNFSASAEGFWPMPNRFDSVACRLEETPEHLMAQFEKHDALGQHKQWPLSMAAKVGIRKESVFRSMATSETSTPSPDRATSSPAAFPVSPFHRPGSGSVRTTPATCGHTPFAYWSSRERRWDSSRMCLDFSAQATSEPFSETWPKRGSMRNGACWEQTMSVPRIDASGCGFWPTARTTGLDGGSNSRRAAKARGMWPTATATTRECTPEQWQERREQQGGTLRSTYLQDAVKYQADQRTYPTPTVDDANNAPEAPGGSTRRTWGTPRSSDYKGSGPVGSKSHRHMLERDYLCAQVKTENWATPRQSDWKGARTRTACMANRVAVGQQDLAEDVIEKTETNGSLNPTWVEWLMGWPRGWTDSEHSVTDRSLRRWLLRSRTWLERLGF